MGPEPRTFATIPHGVLSKLVAVALLTFLLWPDPLSADSSKDHYELDVGKCSEKVAGTKNDERLIQNAIAEANSWCSGSGGVRIGGRTANWLAQNETSGNTNYCRVTGEIKCNGVTEKTTNWYGFSNSSNKDRESELRRNCKVQFTRIHVSSGIDFNSLCSTLSKSCKRVCDWEGNIKTCGETHYSHGDGSRIALCE